MQRNLTWQRNAATICLQGRVQFPTGGKVRARKLNRCDSGTDSIVWMKEDSRRPVLELHASSFCLPIKRPEKLLRTHIFLLSGDTYETINPSAASGKSLVSRRQSRPCRGDSARGARLRVPRHEKAPPPQKDARHHVHRHVLGHCGGSAHRRYPALLRAVVL